MMPMSEQFIERVMEQAQVFASAWSLVGGRFDTGFALAESKNAKAELKAMLVSGDPAAASTREVPDEWRKAMADLLKASDDLLADMRRRAKMRGDIDHDGYVILDCGNSVLFGIDHARDKARTTLASEQRANTLTATSV